MPSIKNTYMHALHIVFESPLISATDSIIPESNVLSVALQMHRKLPMHLPQEFQALHLASQVSCRRLSTAGRTGQGLRQKHNLFDKRHGQRRKCKRTSEQFWGMLGLREQPRPSSWNDLSTPTL